MEAYINHMGLWDLRSDAGGTLARVPTGLERRYAELAAGGTAEVGGDQLPIEYEHAARYDQEEPAREIA
jgi:hypothetical protein